MMMLYTKELAEIHAILGLGVSVRVRVLKKYFCFGQRRESSSARKFCGTKVPPAFRA